RGRRPLVGYSHDASNDRGQGLIDRFVRDAEHIETASGQNLIALGIVGGLLLVIRAVDLHHEPRSMAIEVHDEAVDDLLTTEEKTTGTLGTQRLPEDLLPFGHPAPHLLGAL